MSLFDFFKKKKTTLHEQRQPQEPMPQWYPPQQTHPQQMCPPQQMNVKIKSSIADYFNLDILHICPDEYTERVTLPVSELEMFPYVEVHSNGGTVNSVEFISHSKKFNSELTELINRCATTFGPTKSGESVLTQRDSFLLQRGRFSRMWPKIWFECGPDEENGGLTALRITIFSPSQNGNICLM